MNAAGRPAMSVGRGPAMSVGRDRPMTGERGAILFACEWERTPPLQPDKRLHSLIEWRNRLARRDLIGVDRNGIGYGNLSVRTRSRPVQFLISGTQTGHLEVLTEEHFSHVVDFDTRANRVVCRGPVQASSESLTHGTIYRERTDVWAVIHGHHSGMWWTFINRLPTTRPGIVAGTPEMADEITRVIAYGSDGPYRSSGAIVLAGHQDGIIAFGPDLDACGRRLLKLLDDLPDTAN